VNVSPLDAPIAFLWTPDAPGLDRGRCEPVPTPSGDFRVTLRVGDRAELRVYGTEAAPLVGDLRLSALLQTGSCGDGIPTHRERCDAGGRSDDGCNTYCDLACPGPLLVVRADDASTDLARVLAEAGARGVVRGPGDDWLEDVTELAGWLLYEVGPAAPSGEEITAMRALVERGGTLVVTGRPLVAADVALLELLGLAATGAPEGATAAQVVAPDHPFFDGPALQLAEADTLVGSSSVHAQVRVASPADTRALLATDTTVVLSERRQGRGRALYWNGHQDALGEPMADFSNGERTERLFAQLLSTACPAGSVGVLPHALEPEASLLALTGAAIVAPLDDAPEPTLLLATDWIDEDAIDRVRDRVVEAAFLRGRTLRVETAELASSDLAELASHDLWLLVDAEVDGTRIEDWIRANAASLRVLVGAGTHLVVLQPSGGPAQALSAADLFTVESASAVAPGATIRCTGGATLCGDVQRYPAPAASRWLRGATDLPLSVVQGGGPAMVRRVWRRD
jgi:hypothetical protein